MQTLLELLQQCAERNTFDTGDPENRTVLDQLIFAYRDSRKSRMGSKNWMPTWKLCRWMTSMRSGICVSGSVLNMNAKLSSMASITAHNL